MTRFGYVKKGSDNYLVVGTFGECEEARIHHGYKDFEVREILKKYEITTTLLRKIIVTAKSSEEAERVASSQFKEEHETVLMTSSVTKI